MIKKHLFKLISVMLISLFALRIFSTIYSKNQNPLLEGLICYLVPIIIIIAFIFAFKAKDYLKFSFNNINKVFVYGWYILLAGVIFFVINYLSLEQGVTTTSQKVIGFIITCLFTAVFEELLCRGFIQGTLKDIGNKCGWSDIKHIVLGSCVFALLHLLNLIQQPYLVLGTITQVFYTFSLGMILGVVYYKTKNLVIPIILHAVFNILGSYTDVYLTTAQANVVQADIPIISAVIQLVVMMPAIFVAYKMFKYKKG